MVNVFEGKIHLAAGVKITGSTISSKTLTFKCDDVVLAEYIAHRYYIMQAYNDITLSEDVEIIPETEDYSCTVTIGKSDDDYKYEVKVNNVSYGTAKNSKIYEFQVEYKATVKFEMYSSNGILTYTYTFTDGAYTTTVIYTTSDSNYAMKYELCDNGNRKSIFNSLGTDNKTSMKKLVWSDETETYSYSESITSKIKEITPTFGKKQYNVTLKDK